MKIHGKESCNPDFIDNCFAQGLIFHSHAHTSTHLHLITQNHLDAPAFLFRFNHLFYSNVSVKQIDYTKVRSLPSIEFHRYSAEIMSPKYFRFIDSKLTKQYIYF